MAKRPEMAIVKGILSYPHLFEKHSMMDSAGNPSGTPAYACSVVFSKSDTKTLEALKAAVKVAVQKGKEKFGWTDANVQNKKFNNPIHDGDEDKLDSKDYETMYKGKYYINCRNTRDEPQVVDINRNPIQEERDIYAGCLVRVSVSAFPFEKNGNRGISLGLHNVQKLADGEHLGGGSTSAYDDFDEVDEETKQEAMDFAASAAKDISDFL